MSENNKDQDLNASESEETEATKPAEEQISAQSNNEPDTAATDTAEEEQKEEEQKPPKRPSPLPLRFNAGRDRREHYQRVVEKNLKGGKPLPLIIESSRLVDKNHSPEAAKVVTYIKGVLDRLAKATTGKPSPEMKIYLSDLNGINTGIITDAKPPILLVGLGMIDKIVEYGFGEDHLAAILGHERFHYLRHNKWQNLKNGRPEETAADFYGIHESSEAGYNPSSLGDFFRGLKTENHGNHPSFQTLSNFFDEHPSIDDRIRNSELALANMQLTKRMKEEYTPIPADILEAADNIHFEGHFEAYKKQQDYDDATPAQKMKLIGDYFQREIEKEEFATEGAWYERTKDSSLGKRHKYALMEADDHLIAHRFFSVFFDMHKLHGEDGVQDEAMRQLKRFMKWDYNEQKNYKRRRYSMHESKTDEHYTWLLEQLAVMASPETPQNNGYIDYSGYGVIGDDGNGMNRGNGRYDKIMPPLFLKIRTHAQDFLGAKSKEDALLAARKYESAKHYLGAQYENGMSTLRLEPDRPEWPRRSEIRDTLNEGNPFRLPWQDLVNWATDSSTSKEDQERLKRVATDIGVDDPRLSDADISEWHNGRGYNQDSAIFFSQLTLDDDGNITDMKLSHEEIMAKYRERFSKAETAAELYASEYKLQKQREKQEKELLKDFDWSYMEEPETFWSFIMLNDEHLEPIHTIVPGRYYFTEEFMKRLNAQYENDPEKWHETYVSFVTGHDFEKEREEQREREKAKREGKHYYGSGRDEDKARPYSIPDLIKESEAKYSGYASHYDDYKRDFRGKRGELPEKHPMAKLLGDHHDTRRKRTRYRTSAAYGGIHMEYEVRPKKVPAAEEEVEIPLGIARNHPFAKAILAYDLKNGYMSFGHRANMISNFKYYDPDADTEDKFFLLNPRRVFNHASFNTAASFRKYDRKQKNHEINRAPSYLWGEVKSLELLRTLRRFEDKKPRPYLDISKLGFMVVTNDFGFLHNKELASDLNKELKRRVDRQLRHNRTIDFKMRLPLETLMNRYISYQETNSGGLYGHGDSSHNIFAFRPHLLRQYQSHIRKRIMKLPQDERLPHLQKLMSVQIKNPSYREWAIDEWVEATFANIGKDSGTEEYRQGTLKVIKQVLNDLDPAQGMNCVLQLLDRIEAQRDLALKTKELLSDHYGRQFLEKDGAMRIIESAVDTCAHDPVLRDAFLKYITEPLTATGTKNFAHIVKKKAGSKYSRSDFVKEFYDPEKHFSLAPLQEQTVVDYLHQNFWSLPFELRTVYLDRMLFPVREDEEESFNKSVQFVLDKVLPAEKKFAPEAREALEVYLEQCPKELRRTTFSAILATAEQAAQKGELRPGEVLSYVLARTGAAGGQLLQAAHSYLSGIEITDPDLIQFRDDLKDSKVNFSKPKRWEIFERMDEALPEELIKSIKRVGKTLGSGSTAYVIACEKEDQETAIKLMRKDVEPIADLQFERYGNAFQILADRHTHYKALPSMLKSAKRLLRTSTNGLIGKTQIDYAQKEYAPLSISVNGQTYKFDVAPCISAGKEHIETNRIYGVHLNDLSSSPEKQGYSIAIEAAEIYRMLQGKATDKDRHGGQQGLSQNVIGMFDVGQLPYDLEQKKIAEPTADEKRALGQVLGIAFNQAASGGAVVQTLVDTIAQDKWGIAKDYLVSEQRALLARMDVHKGFGKTEAERAPILTAIFAAVWQSGQIDQDIFKGLTETVNHKTIGSVLKSTLQGTDKPSFEIQITDAHIAPEDFMLTRLDAVKIAAQSGIKRIFNAVAPMPPVKLDDGLKTSAEQNDTTHSTAATPAP